jgi:hypothetical protein
MGAVIAFAFGNVTTVALRDAAPRTEPALFLDRLIEHLEQSE